MASAVLSVAEMYRADQAAMAAGVPGPVLMENAGAGIARAVQAAWEPQPVLVLAGPGNNGGDGFVVARHLGAAGWPVRLGLLGDRGRLSGDAAHHAALWEGEILPPEPALFDDAALVVDALFGAGLSRPLDGIAATMVQALAERGLPVVAVDVPSGLSGDSGVPLGELCVSADLTVTFFRKKPGHLLLPGRQLCGRIEVVDIGIPASALEGIAPRTYENGPPLWQGGYPWRQADSHKYDFGHVLVRGGAVVTGAGRLAADAALRIGAGLVTVASPPESLPIYAQANPSLIMAPLGDGNSWDGLLEDRRRNAVLVGPGNGVDEATRQAALAALAAGRRLVLDADGLTAFQDRQDLLFTAIADHAGDCLLTPHDGEFHRLFPDLEGSKLERARAAARRSGATLLLKGGDSVVAAPDGEAVIETQAPPWLATAGSGDVLAGMIAGLLAQCMPALAAASAATWVHGACARQLGVGLIASDVAGALPVVLQRLAADSARS